MVHKAKIFNFCLIIFSFIFLPSLVSLLKPITDQQLIHDSAPWIVVKDEDNNIIAVETTDQEVLNSFLFCMEEQLIGQLVGKICIYDNSWGFRFDPETVTFNYNSNLTSPYASSISDISANLFSFLHQNRWFYASVISVNFKFLPLEMPSLIFTLFSLIGLITTICCQFIAIKKGII